MSLNNMKILIFVADEYEEMELYYPKYRLIEEGAKVTVAGLKGKETYKGKHGLPAQSDISIEEVNVNDFQALIIPGGFAPDKLRSNQKVQEITQQFNKQNKLIAFICHAGWIPISAKVIKDIKCTSVGSLKDDLINAGAKWVDEPVVIDKNFISSRRPDDLPLFGQAIVNYLNNATPTDTSYQQRANVYS